MVFVSSDSYCLEVLDLGSRSHVCEWWLSVSFDNHRLEVLGSAKKVVWDIREVVFLGLIEQIKL